MSNDLESKTITGTVKKIYKIPINGSTINYKAGIVVIIGSYYDAKGVEILQTYSTYSDDEDAYDDFKPGDEVIIETTYTDTGEVDEQGRPLYKSHDTVRHKARTR